MAKVEQLTKYTIGKQKTDADIRQQGMIVSDREEQISTAGQTVITLVNFVVDMDQKMNFLLFVDGQLLTDGVDYNFTSIVGNISKEITLVVPIIIGLNIAAIKMGTQIAQFPNPDSVAAALIDIIPAGIIMPFGGSSAPVGWLLCDGASLSTTAYPKLYAAIQTNFGSAGAGFFNAPNTRGVFLRGAGSQTISGITYTGTLGIAANDKFQGHYHNTYGAGSGSRWGAGSTDGSTGDNNYPIYEAITDGTNGTPRTGAETVPANLSVNYIIKC